jgi:hypothetical protein
MLDCWKLSASQGPQGATINILQMNKRKGQTGT